MPKVVNRKSFIVNRKKQNLQTTNDERRTTNQSGFSQIILPLFLIAAIGVTVFLVQQRTNLIPFAQENLCNDPGAEDQSVKGGQVADKAKDLEFGNIQCHQKVENINVGCKSNVTIKVEGQPQPTNFQVGCVKTRQQTVFANGFVIHFTWSDGRESWDYKKRAADGGGTLIQNTGFSKRAGANLSEKKGDGTLTGGYGITTFADKTVEYNKFGRDGDNNLFQPYESFAIYSPNYNGGVPINTAEIVRAVLGQGTTGTSNQPITSGSTNIGSVRNQGNSGLNQSCDDPGDCTSGNCKSGKCIQGTLTANKECSDNSQCASNKCNAGKCAAPTTTNNTTNNTSSNSTARNGTSNTTSGNTTGTPVTNTTAGTGTNTTTGTAAPVTLTKAEITGFKASYDAFYPKLGAAKDTGNLKVVSTIANTELASIIAELPTCPDDANVGTCVDSKFRRRFDLAKTAARLSAFYATFNSIPGACVKADLGLNPLISATSQAGSTGRVNLCTDRLVASRIWMIFAGGKFVPVLSTDTKYPQNPTCAGLPADVLTHFRQAEGLFKNQAGFVENTVCDGKTTVAPGGGV